MKFIKVEVFLPPYNKEKVVTALNNQGILKYGLYDSVYSETRVKGHFRPLKGSNPTEGIIGEVCDIEEIKLEFRIRKEDKHKTVEIIKDNHAYEEAVINMIELL